MNKIFKGIDILKSQSNILKIVDLKKMRKDLQENEKTYSNSY